MENVHTEERNGLNITIWQDQDPQSPADWGDDGLFLVGYHRDFSVDGPRTFYKTADGKRRPGDKGTPLVSRADVIALVHGRAAAKENGEEYPAELAKKYHVYPLEAYIHSGVHLALVEDGEALPDRRWDVSVLGAVFVARTEFKGRERARKLARAHVGTWNDYLSGNVYGYTVEGPDGEMLESCGGYSGDYDAKDGVLDDARADVDRLTNNGATEADGQRLFPFAQNAAALIGRILPFQIANSEGGAA